MKRLHQQIGLNTFIQAIGKTIFLFLSFILTGFLTRYLGLRKYGEYTTIFAYLGFFAIIGEFGLDQVLIKELSKIKNKPRNKMLLINNVLGLRLILISISVTLAILFSLLVPYEKIVRLGIFIVSFSSFFNYFSSALMSYFQAKLNFFYPILADIIGKIVFFIISLFLILVVKGGLFPLVSVSIFGGLITFLIILYFFKHDNMSFCFAFNFPLWRKLMFFALPVALVSFLNQVFFRIDVPLLSLISGSEAVGIYGLAFRIYDFSSVPASLFVSSVFPVLASRIRSKPSFTRVFKKSFILLLAAGGIASLFLKIFGQLLVDILGGEDFTLSILPFKILNISLVFLYFSDLLRVTMITLEKQKRLLCIYLFVAILSIFLNLIFMPKFSYFAASWVCVAARTLLVLGMGITILKNFISESVQVKSRVLEHEAPKD